MKEPRKYRKRVVTEDVVAIQWTGGNLQDIYNYWGEQGFNQNLETGALYLTTIGGIRVHCCLGDWIIAEPVAHRYYPCDPKVFADRYEQV